MNLAQQIQQADSRIKSYIRETPLEYSHYLSAKTGAQVYLKLENVQHTGSFKFRGAMSKMLSLSEAQRAKGVVAASSGNHGMAASYAAKLLDTAATIFVASDAAAAKIERIRQIGGEIELAGDNCVHAEKAARARAEADGLAYVSPYNDLDVIAGQGTIGLELHKQLPQVDAVLVAVGGGGLISGIGGYLKSVRQNIRIIGCQPENSRVMYESIRAGRVIDYPEQPTLSDGTAGGIEKNSVTLALCQQYVDGYVLVAEQEIAAAMRLILAHENWLVEGAAGVAVAGFLRKQENFSGKNVVLILCGRNIGLEKIRAILAS
ncbi:MAG: threonine/serine dehydratase [bacterium]